MLLESFFYEIYPVNWPIVSVTIPSKLSFRTCATHSICNQHRLVSFAQEVAVCFEWVYQINFLLYQPVPEISLPHCHHICIVSLTFNYFLELVHLHASSAVQDGSTAYYDPSIATWVLNLTLRIPKLGSTSSPTSKIMFRVDLALPNETELKRNPLFSSCRNSSLPFVGDCRERNLYTKYFSQSKDEAEVKHKTRFLQK